MSVVHPSDRLGLTRREYEVLELAASGLTIPDIARRLWLVQNTVKFHRTNLMRKLGVRSMAQAVAMFHGNHERLDGPVLCGQCRRQLEAWLERTAA